MLPIDAELASHNNRNVICAGAMNPAPFALLAFVVIATTFGKEPAPTVTFVSPCECIAFHGINRWITKTDLSPVRSDKSAIQAVTPSQIYAWEGLPPDGKPK
jgi:hypothetical protein